MVRYTRTKRGRLVPTKRFTKVTRKTSGGGTKTTMYVEPSPAHPLEKKQTKTISQPLSVKATPKVEQPKVTAKKTPVDVTSPTSKEGMVWRTARLIQTPGATPYVEYDVPVSQRKKPLPSGTKVWGGRTAGIPASEAKEREEIEKTFPFYKAKTKKEPYVPADIPITTTQKINKRLSQALPEWRPEGTTTIGKAFFKTPLGSTSEKIVGASYGDIKEQPLKAGTIAAVSLALPYAKPIAAAAVTKLGTKAPTVVSTVGKIAKTGLITTYGASKAEELYFAPTWKAKGDVVRKTLTTEILPAVAGGALGSATQPKVTDYAQARYRSLKFAGKWRIPTETSAKTFSFDPKKAQLDPSFTAEGVQKGYQMRLKDLPRVQAEYLSQQAKFMPERLSPIKSAKAQDQYLGKWLARPLKPEVTEAIQTGQRGFYSKDISYFIEPTKLPKTTQTSFDFPKKVWIFDSSRASKVGVVTTTVKYTPKPPRSKLASMFKSKRAELITVEQPKVIPESTEYWNIRDVDRFRPSRTIKPYQPPIPDNLFIPATTTGVTSALLFRDVTKQKPLTRTLTRQIPRIETGQITSPAQRQVPDITIKAIQRQAPKRRLATGIATTTFTPEIIKIVPDAPIIPRRTRIKVPKPPTPTFFIPDFDIDLRRPKDKKKKKKKKKIKVKSGYRPSPAGLFSDITIPKAPKIAGTGIRYPTRL